MLQDDRNELRSVVAADGTASRESLLNKVVPIIIGFIDQRVWNDGGKLFLGARLSARFDAHRSG
jgi:hypothetical protein